MHPARSLKRAMVPKPIKRARRALHPIDNAGYALERSLTTKRLAQDRRDDLPARQLPGEAPHRGCRAQPPHRVTGPVRRVPSCGRSVPAWCGGDARLELLRDHLRLVVTEPVGGRSDETTEDAGSRGDNEDSDHRQLPQITHGVEYGLCLPRCSAEREGHHPVGRIVARRSPPEGLGPASSSLEASEPAASLRFASTVRRRKAAHLAAASCCA
jgi:hypothetical protein